MAAPTAIGKTPPTKAEEKIINVFENIRKNDWVFCSWLSHYQCLLKGVPAKKLRKKF